MDAVMSRARYVSLLALLGSSVFLLTIAIWPFGFMLSAYDEKRLLQILLLTSLIVIILLFPSLRKQWKQRLEELPSVIVWMLLSIIGFGIASTLYAVIPYASLTEIAMWVSTIMAITMMASLREQLSVRFDVAMFAMLAILLCVYLFVVFGFIGQAVAGTRDFDFRLLYSNFTHLRFFNQLQTWTLPLAVLPLLYVQGRGWSLLKWLMFAALVNWWMMLFLSGGRGALLAVVTSSLLVGVLVGKRSESWLKWQAAAGILGFGFYLVISQLLPALVAHFVENPTLARISFSGRDELWRLALSMISEHPLLGVGPMHYACSDAAMTAHPHNAVLQVAAEWGIPAVLLLTSSVAWLLYRAAVLTRSQSYPAYGVDVAPPLLASMLAALLHAQLSGIIVMPISQLMMVFVGGWMWGTLSPGSEKIGSGNARCLVAGGMVISAALILLSTILPYWRADSNGVSETVDETKLYMPRFWLDGQICSEGSRWLSGVDLPGAGKGLRGLIDTE